MKKILLVLLITCIAFAGYGQSQKRMKVKANKAAAPPPSTTQTLTIQPGGAGVTLKSTETGTKYTWTSTPAPVAPFAATRTIVVNPAATTTYDVAITNGAKVTHETTVINVPIPAAGPPAVPGKLTITTAAIFPMDIGNSATLTAQGGTSNAYYWYPPTTLSESTGTSVVAQPLTTTNYIVVCPKAGGGNDTAKITVKVNNIGAQSLSFAGALYSNIKLTPDNDPSGFSQYYLSGSIPFGRLHGLSDINSTNFMDNVVWFRNLYLQPTVSVKANNAPVLRDTVNKERHANYMDLYQNAFFRIPAKINILTWMAHKQADDYVHIYLDILTGLFFTKDTVNKSSDLIASGTYGLSLSAKTEGGLSSKFTVEASISAFSINPFTDAFQPNLAPQYAHLSDTTLSSNSAKPVLKNTNWVLGFDFLVSYHITGNGNSSTVNSYVYVHFDDFHNATFSSGNYANNYFQVQAGYSLNIDDLFSALSKSTTGSSATTASAPKSSSAPVPLF